MVIGFSGKRLMVTIGPLRAMGFMTILTLAPSDSLASTIGEASFTTLLHPATICCITSWSFSVDSNPISSSLSLPSCSTKIWSFPLIIISVTELSSTNICRISSLRSESNSSCFSRLRVSTG